MFALDVKSRCHRIHSTLSDRHAGDNRKITSLMPRVIEATLDCYSGDCHKCRYHSIVCAGGKNNNWWHTSMWLQCGHISHVNMTDTDRVTLRKVMENRIQCNYNVKWNSLTKRVVSLSGVPGNACSRVACRHPGRRYDRRASAGVRKLDVRRS